MQTILRVLNKRLVDLDNTNMSLQHDSAEIVVWCEIIADVLKHQPKDENVLGFDESMKYGGENDQLRRYIAKNESTLYQPLAVVYHQPRNSIRAVFKWFVRRGYADVHHAIIENKSSYSLGKFLKNARILHLIVLAIVSVLSGLGLILSGPVSIL